MTFPTIPTTGNGRLLSQFQANTTATRTFPNLSSLTGKASGHLLVAIVVAYERSAAGATFSGWTGGFAEVADVDGGATTMAVGIATKTSTGSETGTFAVTQAATVTGHVGLFVMAIEGWDGATAPEVTALAVGTGAVADPGALAPSWGAADTLWISVGGVGETNTGGAYTGIGGATNPPTNYGDSNGTGESADVVGAIGAGVAFRQNNTSSEDVGPWGSVDTSNARNCALLIAIRPTAPAGITGTADVALPALAADAAGSVDVEGTSSTVLPALDASAAGTVALGPVREFDGTDDEIVTATGGCSGMGFGTVAALFKPRDFSGTNSIFRPHTSGGTHIGQMLGVNTSGQVQWSAGGTGSAGPTLTAARWYLVVMRKATGTVTPRFSVYDYTTTGWTHANGSATRPDLTAPGASGTIRMSFQSTADFFDGWMAVRAAWSNSLPWSADTIGDTAIEGAGLEDSLQAWVDASPSALWPFNQDAVGDGVLDIIGAADESSRVGTAVVITDSPDPFDWSLVTGVEGTATVVLPALDAAAAGSVDVEGTAAAVLPALGATAAGAVTVTGTDTTVLPALATTAAGQVDVEGTTTAVLPALAVTAAGTVEISGVGGPADVVLPALAATATGALEVSGAVAATLPALGVVLAGSVVEPITGTVAAALPALSATATGELEVVGAATTTLPALAVDLTGTVLAAGDIAGTVTVVLPALGVAAEVLVAGVPGSSTLAVRPAAGASVGIAAVATGRVLVDTAATGSIG